MDWRYRDTALALATLANFSQFGARLVISPLVPDLIREFAVSKSTVGLALTGVWVAFALFQYPSGVLADRHGERPIILVALGLTAGTSLLLALSPTFAAFVVFAVLLGAGAGLYFSVGTALVSRLHDNSGQALGIHSAGGPFAGLVMPVAAAWVAGRLGWRQAFLLGAGVAALTCLLIWWRVRPTPPAREAEDGTPLAAADGGLPATLADDVRAVWRSFHPRTVLGLLSRPEVAFTTAIAVVGMYVFQSFVSFFPTFLVEHHGLTQSRASLLFGVAFVLSAACLPLAGRLADHTSRDAVLAGALAVAAGGFAAVLFGGGPLVLAGVAVLGVGLSWGGVLQARFMANFTEAERGTGFGLVRSTFILLGAAGNAVTGVLADTVGWGAAYGVVVALLVLAVGALLANEALGLEL